MIALYHQIKTPIGFWCLQELNPKSLIQSLIFFYIKIMCKINNAISFLPILAILFLSFSIFFVFCFFVLFWFFFFFLFFFCFLIYGNEYPIRRN